MRQRKVKNLDEKLAALGEYTVNEPESLRGRWNEFFGNDDPIYLEIGCGKGQFISKHAELHPDRNYIAVEGQDSVVVRAMEKAAVLAERSGRKSLVIVFKYVNDIGEMFAEGELAGIYLNFSDPWPKDRHRKRRLTYRNRLESYMKAIAAGGFIDIKTDNDGLFEFTLEEIEACGYEIAVREDDLHGAAQGTAAGGAFDAAQSGAASEAASVTTEYEDKFMAMGLPIHYVRLEKHE